MALGMVLKSGEVKLMEALSGLSDAHGWQAIHFHLCDLLEQYQSEYQVKIAVNLIYDLLKVHDGGIYLLSDNSIMVMAYGLDKPLVGKLIFQMRYLYLDDPLAYSDEGVENPDFCTLYDLSHSWQELLNFCSRRMAIAVRRPAPVRQPAVPVPVEPVLEARNAPASEMAAMPEAAAVPRSAGLSAIRLANIERDLQHADLSRVLRRQPVCAIVPGSAPRRVFDELYIHIAHLRQLLRVDADFLSNRWLFKYLTQTLDERMIEMLKRNPAPFAEGPISLNLNVESLLSSWFGEFNAALKPAHKVSMVIEIPVIDAFADMTAFFYAKDEAQRLGYRVCLDGLTTSSFLNISSEKLGLDLLKVQWNADATSDLKNAENQRLMEAVQLAGSNRIILCRCDNRQAVDYGHALGISLFQGRYVDSIVNPNARVAN